MKLIIVVIKVLILITACTNVSKEQRSLNDLHPSKKNSSNTRQVNYPTDANEQLRLGEKYAFGKGVRRNDKIAAELFQLSAEQGNAEAQYKLGVMLDRGLGIPLDSVAALKWYAEAAKQGHGGAKVNIGQMYQSGRLGITRDEQQALNWYRSAAEQGVPEANFNLGYAYLNGIGVQKNTEKAIEYLKIAERQGLSEATKKLQEIEKRNQSTVTANTIEKCGATPKNYHQHDYGDVLYSIQKPCNRTLTPKEQTFVAGMSQYLLEKCGFPKNADSRIKLQRFLTSSMFVGAIGSQHSNPELKEAIGDQVASTTAYAAGAHTAKSIGCSGAGKELADEIVSYLDQTAEVTSGHYNFVEGCANYYSGRYTKEQCKCIADIGRSVFPNIHQSHFSRSGIQNITKSNPYAGILIGIQCRIGDY